jgi:hypothetical protein
MLIYEEEVQLRRFMSPARELFHLGSAIALAGFIYWSEIYGKNIRAHPLSSLSLAVFVALEILPFLMVLNAALFPSFCLQIGDQAVLLKRGFVRKKVSLDTIVEVSSVSASRVKKTRVLQTFYQSADFLFLDRRDFPNIELLLSGGKSMYVATPRAEEVAGILRREVERFQRESALSLIAAHQPKPL